MFLAFLTFIKTKFVLVLVYIKYHMSESRKDFIKLDFIAVDSEKDFAPCPLDDAKRTIPIYTFNTATQNPLVLHQIRKYCSSNKGL